VSTIEPHGSRGVLPGEICRYIASRLPEVRGWAGAGAASASYASCHSGSISSRNAIGGISLRLTDFKVGQHSLWRSGGSVAPGSTHENVGWPPRCNKSPLRQMEGTDLYAWPQRTPWHLRYKGAGGSCIRQHCPTEPCECSLQLRQPSFAYCLISLASRIASSASIWLL
jgi:hypothetical protein